MAQIVFDLDGTLIDSIGEIHEAVARMLKSEGLAPLDLPTVTSFVGNGLPTLVERVIGVTPLAQERHAELTENVLAEYNALGGTLTQTYPHVRDALDALLASGHTLGICTNKPEAPARHILDFLDMKHFAVISGGDTLPTRKPDPAPLQDVFDRMGSGAQIYVGDSEVDAETAQRAGVPFLLFTEGYRKSPVQQIPHHIAFDDFADLPDLIQQMLAKA